MYRPHTCNGSHSTCGVWLRHAAGPIWPCASIDKNIAARFQGKKQKTRPSQITRDYIQVDWRRLCPKLCHIGIKMDRAYRIARIPREIHHSCGWHHTQQWWPVCSSGAIPATWSGGCRGGKRDQNILTTKSQQMGKNPCTVVHRKVQRSQKGNGEI